MSPRKEVMKQECTIGQFKVTLSRALDAEIYHVSFSCKDDLLAYYEYQDRVHAFQEYHVICDMMTLMIDAIRRDSAVTEAPVSTPYSIYGEADSGTFNTVPERKMI